MAKNKREDEVLDAIIKHYLIFGEPIGSETLVKSYNINVSSATIRNVMSNLESMNYIEKAHSSSGRAPTLKGYKYYIQYLLEKYSLSEKEIETIKSSYKSKIKEMELMLSQSASLLSELTHYTGIALEPNLYEEKLKRLTLIYLDNYNIMMIIVTENLYTRTNKIYLNESINEGELEKIQLDLNKRFKGSNVKEMLIFLIKEGKFKSNKTTLENIEASFYIDDNYINENINVNASKNKIKNFLENFIKEEKIKNKSINIIFGEDLDIEYLKDLSIVFAVYESNNSYGVIGIIGPKRMEYSKISSLVEQIAKELNNLINCIEGG